MKIKQLKNCLLASLVLLLAGTLAGAVEAAPKSRSAAAPMLANMAKVKAGDCAGCHKGKQVLPKQHVATKEMTYADCVGCHVAGSGNPGSLRTKLPGGHLHGLRGIQCAQCHGKGQQPAVVSMNKCVSCHGDTKALAAKTADVKPRNPHENRHYGTEADCSLCHHQHAKSKNFCSSCHNFKFMVP